MCVSFLTKFKYKIFFINPAFSQLADKLFPVQVLQLGRFLSYMHLTTEVFNSSNLWKHLTFSTGCREEEEIKFPGIFYECLFFFFLNKIIQETVKVKYFVVAFVCFQLLFLNQVTINIIRVHNATKTLFAATSSTSSQCVYANGPRIVKCDAVVRELLQIQIK